MKGASIAMTRVNGNGGRVAGLGREGHGATQLHVFLESACLMMGMYSSVKNDTKTILVALHRKTMHNAGQ